MLAKRAEVTESSLTCYGRVRRKNRVSFATVMVTEFTPFDSVRAFVTGSHPGRLATSLFDSR
jgi:hypothetical protein